MTTADSFKMKTITGLVFCALLMSLEIMIVESTVYSSVDTTLKFSQCMIDKISESPFFTPDERNNLIEVRNVLIQGLLKTEQTLSLIKILLIAFITSLTDVIIHDDASRNANRKQLYTIALKQCSLQSAGYVDEEFINEVEKILSIIERNRAMTQEEMGIFSGIRNPAAGTFGSVSYPQISGVNNPIPVQPSPVQNPFIPQYLYPNDKTVFAQQGEFPIPNIASSAQVNANSQYAVQSSSQIDLSSSFGDGMQLQIENFPQTSNFPSSSQNEQSFSTNFALNSRYQNLPTDYEARGISQFEKIFSNPYTETFPLDYDASKRLDTLSDSGTQQTGPVDGTSQVYNGGLNIPQEKGSSVVVIPPNANQQYISDGHLQENQQQEIEKQMPQTSTLENAKSEVSEFTISPSIANTQAQSPYSVANSYPTLQSIIFNILTNSHKFRETFNSEISKENAINLARILAEKTFAVYGLNVKNDALYVVPNEVAKVSVPTPENFALALTNAFIYLLNLYDTILSEKQSQIATDFLSGLDNSRQFYSQQVINEKQSQDYYTPGQYYAQTEIVEKKSQDYDTDETQGELYPQPETNQNQPLDYSTGQTAYSEYDQKQRDFDFESPPLSPEDRKYEVFSISLADYLSKSVAIRDFFCDGNEPEDKVQISFSVIKAALNNYGLHVAPIAASIASGALSELPNERLCNNYAKIISGVIAEALEENAIENANAADIASKMEFNLIQRQITPTEPQNAPIKTESSATSISKGESISADVPDLKSSLTPVEEVNTDFQEKTENLNAVTFSDTQDISDKEDFIPITLQQTSTSLSTTKSTKNPDDWTSDGVTVLDAFADFLTQTFDELLSLDLTGSGEEYENTGENPPINGEDSSSPLTTFSNQQEQDKDTVLQEDKSDTYSTDANVQMSTVELQPSFQEPVPNADDSSARLQPGIQPSTIFARQVSQTAESSIAYIRSQNFDLNNLCTQINQLAPLVNIPVLDYCEPIAAIDYLLNVLRGVVRVLNGM